MKNYFKDQKWNNYADIIIRNTQVWGRVDLSKRFLHLKVGAFPKCLHCWSLRSSPSNTSGGRGQCSGPPPDLTHLSSPLTSRFKLRLRASTPSMFTCQTALMPRVSRGDPG